MNIPIAWEAAPAPAEHKHHKGSGLLSALGSAELNLRVYSLFCLLALLPFLVVEHPPIVDFANHVARMSLSCDIHDPAVSAMYSIKFGLIPNLALDLINWPFCGAVPPAILLKLIIVGALAVQFAACWAIQKTLFGRTNPLLLFVPAMSLNLVTTMGYINFLVGIAVACTMIALALRSQDSRRNLMVIGNVGGIALFFSHIFAFAFTFLFFFGWFVARAGWRPIALLKACLQVAAMFAVPLLLVPFVESSGQPLSLSYSAKLRALMAPFMAQSSLLDFVTGLLILLPLYFLWRSGRASMHPRMRLPLLAVAVYVIAVPSQLQDAIDIDSRTMVALAALLFASLAPTLQGAKAARLLPLLAALPLAFHLLIVASVWQPFSRDVAEFRSAARILPQHASVLSVRSKPAAASGAMFGRSAPHTYYHLASYATADRRIFNPLEFTGVGMQPLSSHGRFAALDIPASVPLPTSIAADLKQPTDPDFMAQVQRSSARYAVGWHEKFDYVVHYHFGGEPNFDPATLELVHAGSFFAILRVARSAPAQPAA